MSESMQVDTMSTENLTSVGIEKLVQRSNNSVIPVCSIPGYSLPFQNLETYMQNYEGHVHFLRLMFIAERDPQLAPSALKIAHDYLKNHSIDYESYNKLFVIMAGQKRKESAEFVDDQGDGEENLEPSAEPDAVLVSVMSGDNKAGIVYDKDWVTNTRRKCTIEFERLDTELKNSKANPIKESIRRGSDNLGDFYMMSGQLSVALKHYTRSKDYCVDPYQELVMCLNIIRIAIYQGSWSSASAYVNKAEDLPETRDTMGINHDTNGYSQSNLLQHTAPPVASLNFKETLAKARTRLSVAGGLCDLALRKYKSSANYFLQASYDHLDMPASFVTPSDIAYYVTLCALATMDRSELSSLLLGGNTNARALFGAEPVCREILQAFYHAEYATCLSELAKLEPFFKLDIYLSEHVATLMSEIRCRALCQYFSPYVSANLDEMARAFNTDRKGLENELALLIQNGHIQGRIDSHNGILKALNVDHRCISFAEALEATEDYKNSVQTAMMRIALARYRLSVQQAAEQPAAASGGSHAASNTPMNR